MIYLTTGANGAGKTLLTLRDVREKSLSENRPVAFNGRFDMVADFGWKRIAVKDWQAEPDGTIFLFDECHNPDDFPIRSSSQSVPGYINALGEHRKRGFDFYLITQHPGNIDIFIRKIIGSPGWHRHLKRASGAPLVSVLTWPAVNDQPQKNGSGSSAQTSMVKFPREVYNWYTSTSLDTAKLKIPFQAKLLVVALLLVPLLGWYGYKTMTKRFEPKEVVSSVAPAGVGGPTAPVKPVVLVATTADLLASYQPRIDGLVQTAPRYDDLTKPVNVPYPAACVSMGERCNCYTQQATKLTVPKDLCLQIVKGGYFNDWLGALADASSGKAVKANPSPIASL